MAYIASRQPCRGNTSPTMVDLGELRALVYRAGERSYIHFLETPARLTCDASGQQLYIVGGKYRVTPRGIEG